jgi:hypothetical protein
MEDSNIFCILRLQKIKSMTGLRRSFKHTFREQKTPNADSDRLSLNVNLEASNSNEAMSLFHNRLPSKLRKNGVLAVEHVVTASPEFFRGKSKKEINDYFSRAIGFFNKHWGQENVLSANIHYDEKTPHMHLFVCPIDDKTGRLNCRKWLGARDSLSKLQDSFHDDVGSSVGLKRGLKGSKANNQKLKNYYKNISLVESLEKFNLPSKGDYLKASTGRPPSSVINVIQQAKLVHEASVKIDELRKEKDSLLKFISKNENEKGLVIELEGKLCQVRQELNEKVKATTEQNAELKRLQSVVAKQKSKATSNTESIEDEYQSENNKDNEHEIH